MRSLKTKTRAGGVSFAKIVFSAIRTRKKQSKFPFVFRNQPMGIILSPTERPQPILRGRVQQFDRIERRRGFLASEIGVGAVTKSVITNSPPRRIGISLGT